MKKILLITTCSLLLFIYSIPSYADERYYHPSEHSKEEVLMDLFLSLLSPHIDHAVSDFYSNLITESPMVYPYQISILTMERIGQYRSFEFSMTIEVTPVVGPHIAVGKDHLTFYIAPGVVTLTKFKHLESYELPPNWRDIIKKKNNS